MKQIDSPADFQSLLQSEQAIVFIFFPWSNRAVESQAIVQEWENNLAAKPGQNFPPIFELSPDLHSFTWKWFGEVEGNSADAASVNGCVLWLKHGSVVARVADAAAAGIKVLSRITSDCFVLGKILSAEATFMPIATAFFDLSLLQILCCPETRQKLKLATQPLLDQINQQIAASHFQNRSGQIVQDAIDGGLVRADGRYLYPLRQNIPVLLVDEAIPLAGF